MPIIISSLKQMNVPSKSSYQSTCVTRTVSSIDKNKMKLAGIKKCPCPPICIPPTSTTISRTNCITKCNQCDFIGNVTVGIDFPIEPGPPDQPSGSLFPSPPVVYQWYWIDGSGVRRAFTDGNNIFGSQNPTICLTVPTGTCTPYNIYCVYSNNCGSITTNTYSICFELNT